MLRRRTFVEWCLAAFALRPTAKPAALPAASVHDLLATHPAKIVSRYQRHFRVHAAVLVLGLPIFRREDVGAGCASVERGDNDDASVTALQFAAGSRPERARGLNRFGVHHEAAVHRNGLLTGTAYAGFLTSSPEKSLEEAHGAFSAPGLIPCSFSKGSSAEGRTEQARGRFSVRAIEHWKDAPALLARAEQTASSFCDVRPVGPSATFLYAMHGAILDPAPRLRTRFCHNGEQHHLLTEKHPSAPEMMGAILDQSGAKRSEFMVRLDPADPSGIPTHIEFRAKSYLRLTFEAVAAGTETTSLPWLLKEDLA